MFEIVLSGSSSTRTKVIILIHHNEIVPNVWKGCLACHSNALVVVVIPMQQDGAKPLITFIDRLGGSSSGSFTTIDQKYKWM